MIRLMANSRRRPIPPLSLDQPARYRIEIQGNLGAAWSANFGGMTIAVQTNPGAGRITILEGMVADQATLHGILNSIRDLGLPLMAVRYLPGKAEKG